jgi:hypothetical protein
MATSSARRFALAAFAALLALFAALPARALDITACQQRVPEGASAVLSIDLTCPDAGVCEDPNGVGDRPCTQQADCGTGFACHKVAVRVGRGGRVDLQGHTLTGSQQLSAFENGSIGIACLDRCTISGPGVITGFNLGIEVGGARAVVRNLTVQGNVYGVHGGGPQRLLNVVATGNHYGVLSQGDLFATSVDASDNTELGVLGLLRLRGTNVKANSNGRAGVTAIGPCVVSGLIASGNSGPGLAAEGPTVLRSSTITGNNGAQTGFDVLTTSRPRLVRTSCGRSAALIFVPGPLSQEFELDAGASWGVCQGD